MIDRRRGVTWAILWFLPTQLLLGGCLIVLSAQREIAILPTVVEQRISDDVAAVDARVRRIEDLHLEGRLAVLDALNDRSWRIELLVIGLLLTIAGNLLLQAWLQRGGGGSPPYRHSRHDDPADAA